MLIEVVAVIVIRVTITIHNYVMKYENIQILC